MPFIWKNFNHAFEVFQDIFFAFLLKKKDALNKLSGILGIQDVWDVRCLACEMLKMWNVQDVGCSRCGIFGMWDVQDVGC